MVWELAVGFVRGLALTDAKSRAAGLRTDLSGTIGGELAWVEGNSLHSLVFGGRFDLGHDAVIRIGGEVPAGAVLRPAP